MKLFKNLLPIVTLVVTFDVFAVPAVAPDHRIRIWEGSALSFPDSQYAFGNTTAMGTIKTLKSNSTVINLLTTYNAASNTGGLDMSRTPGAVLTSINLNGTNYQRLSDVGIPSGQCVAFARSMTGAPKSTFWYPGKKLTDYVSWNGAGYVLNPLATPALRRGTMIAHFGGKPVYSANGDTPHVAIFLSWSYDAQGYINGVNVIDENLVSVMSGFTGNAAGLIQKHRLAWTCNAGTSCGNVTGIGNGTYHITFFAANYHVVDI